MRITNPLLSSSFIIDYILLYLHTKHCCCIFCFKLYQFVDFVCISYEKTSILLYDIYLGLYSVSLGYESFHIFIKHKTEVLIIAT